MDESPTDAQRSRAEMERLFVSSLPDIERVTQHLARRHRLSPSETDDFLSEVNLAIIQGDYAILSSFEGRSSLRTYLTTVIHRLFLDFRRKSWGKWRPSAQALRLGPVALRLELLVCRDGLSLEEAVETLRTNFACDQSPESLRDLAARLPRRLSRRTLPEAEEVLASLPAGDLERPDAQLDGARISESAQGLISDVMATLGPEDRIVLRMRFEDGISVADIARTLRLDQKRLYRRLDDILQVLRRSLEERGLAWPEVERMIERGQCHLRLPRFLAKKPEARPSLQEVKE